jgi:C1q domain
MSISDGSPVNAANVNANLMSKNVDNTAAGKQTFTNTTQSTDKDTGSVVLEGGLGVEKNINAGGTVSGSNLSGSNSGDVTIGAVGAAPNANGATLTGQVLNLEPADATNPGVMTTGAQTFAGVKTFEDLEAGLRFRLGFDVDAATTGADALLPEPAAPIMVLTNASLVSIDRIDSNESLAYILINRTGVDVTIKNAAGSPANQQILTGTGADLDFKNGSAIWLAYDSDTTKWQVVGGSGAGGTGVIADTMGNILALPRVAGAIYFATDELAYYGDNGTDVLPLDVIVDTLANIQSNYTFVIGKLYYASDENRFYYSDGSSEYVLGPLTEDPVNAGTAGQVLSHDATAIAKFKNPFFELGYYIQKENLSGNNSGNNTLYADASVDPVDASGGSPTATITTSGTNPIAGSNVMSALNQVFTAGTLGDGVRTLSGEVQREHYGKIFKLVFDYHVSSGTYADGDLGLYILDSANQKLMLQPTHLIPNAVGQACFEVYFQMPVQAVATALQDLKVCLHQRTSATGYSIAFNWKIIQAMDSGYAPITTDPVEFDTSAGVWIDAVTTAPTYGTIVRNEGRYSKNSGMTYYTWQYEQSDNTGAASGSGNYLIKLPYKMDLTEYGLAQNFTDTTGLIACAVEGSLISNFNYADFFYVGNLYIYDEQTLYVAARTSSGTYSAWSSSFGQFNAAGVINHTLTANVHTLGQSSQTKTVSEYDGQTVSFKVTHSGSRTTTAGNPIVLDTVEKDSHQMYNASTGEVTIKVAGRYRTNVSGISPSGGDEYIRVYKNGSLISGNTTSLVYALSASYVEAGALEFDFVVGDVVTIRTANGRTLTSNAGYYSATWEMSLNSGAQKITAGERIFLNVNATSGASVTAANPVIFDNVADDSHGSYNASTGEFTAKRSDIYKISTAVCANGATGYVVSVYKNGTLYRPIFFNDGVSTDSFQTGFMELKLLVEDVITIRPSASITLDAGGFTGGTIANSNWLTISSGVV